jgi:Transposase IS116/IS110/IS902 family
MLPHCGCPPVSLAWLSHGLHLAGHRAGRRSKRVCPALDKELTELVTVRGSTLMELHGIGPSGAARLLANAGDIHRFASRDRFASWNGTAPWTPPPAARPATASPAPGTGASTESCTSWRSCSCGPDQWPRLLRRAAGGRHAVDDGHAGAQAAPVQRRLRPHARRPETTRSGPGRATGDAC